MGAEKCFMTSVLVVVYPRSPLQLVLALLLSMVFMSTVLRFGPYARDEEDVLSFVLSTSTTLTYFFGFVKITDMKARSFVTANDLVPESTLGFILILINSAPLLCFILLNC